MGIEWDGLASRLFGAVCFAFAIILYNAVEEKRKLVAIALAAVVISGFIAHNVDINEAETDAWSEGYNVGYSDGQTDGYFEGYDYGYEKGSEDGYNVGYIDGYVIGIEGGEP